MLVKIQTSIKSDGNKGSSYALATYLEKYDVDRERTSLIKNELPKARAGFFNHISDGLTKAEVVHAIDTNKKGLGKNDCKFYALTLAPSKSELKHILKRVAKKTVTDISQLTNAQLTHYENELKDYTRAVMDTYATHFKREGLTNGHQLVYAGKVEHYRAYKGFDDEVKDKAKKNGDIKPGLNSHIHVIIARKDNEMKYKLSPLANEKGNESNSMLNGKRVQRGFDRTLFSIKAETIFDELFNYTRALEDKVIFKIETSKNNNSIEIDLERDPIKREVLKQKFIDQFISKNQYTTQDFTISADVFDSKSILDTMLTISVEEDPHVENDIAPKKKIKKRKIKR